MLAEGQKQSLDRAINDVFDLVEAFSGHPGNGEWCFVADAFKSLSCIRSLENHGDEIPRMAVEMQVLISLVNGVDVKCKERRFDDGVTLKVQFARSGPNLFYFLE